MKYHISLLFFFVSLFINAQETYKKLPKAKQSCPTYLINTKIIANEQFFITHKNEINEISVLKDTSNKTEYDFYNLTAEGIIFIDTSLNIPVKTQKELNLFFGLDPSNNVFIDGYLLEKP